MTTIFVNTTPNNGVFEADTFLFETVKTLIDEAVTIPYRPVKSADEVVKQVLQSIDDDSVVCFTNYGSNMQRTLDVASKVRYSSDAKLLAGGPGIVREKIEGYPDSVESVLQKTVDGKQVYDAAIYGGLSALIEDNPKGYYYLEGEVKGEGMSGYPKTFAYMISEKAGMLELSLFFDTRCNNGCDFCARGSYMKAEALDALDLIDQKIHLLELKDPNPLHPVNIDNTYAMSDIIDSKLGRTYKSMMVDSALLREPYKLYRHLRDLNVVNTFIGMDALTGYEAEIMGARYMVKVKTDDDLREERKGLSDFLQMIDWPFQMLLSFIYLPGRTDEKIMQYLGSLDIPTNVHAYRRVKSLEVYPGTKLLHKYADMLVDDVYFKSKGEDMWRFYF